MDDSRLSRAYAGYQSQQQQSDLGESLCARELGRPMLVRMSQMRPRPSRDRHGHPTLKGSGYCRRLPPDCEKRAADVARQASRTCCAACPLHRPLARSLVSAKIPLAAKLMGAGVSHPWNSLGDHMRQIQCVRHLRQNCSNTCASSA